MTSIKIVQWTRGLGDPLVHLRPKFFHPLDVGRPISNEPHPPPPPSPNDNQSIKKDVIEGLLLYVIESFLQVGFPFQYQLINLACISFDFFSFTEASLSAFSWLYTLYAFVQKYYERSYILTPPPPPPQKKKKIIKGISQYKRYQPVQEMFYKIHVLLLP